MSKQFERLYHAWVLDFRDRYLRWANPAARPWEQSCRACDGACKTHDSLMVLCDHCDAMYGISCKSKMVAIFVLHLSLFTGHIPRYQVSGPSLRKFPKVYGIAHRALQN